MPLGEFQEALCLGEGLPLTIEPSRSRWSLDLNREMFGVGTGTAQRIAREMCG
jgi:hypothetical protein